MNGLDAPQRHFITLCIVIEAFITYVGEASFTPSEAAWHRSRPNEMREEVQPRSRQVDAGPPEPSPKIDTPFEKGSRACRRTGSAMRDPLSVIRHSRFHSHGGAALTTGGCYNSVDVCYEPVRKLYCKIDRKRRRRGFEHSTQSQISLGLFIHKI
ncbi:hypothetical protein HYE67_000340 [Fusarium culmorum]|uniref:Uncharacterized protein n=1 Tax=Fusarium culmorum TaxID=5516 RepID=A0A2T4GKH8_FUSCU|nr:hypothetical protein FCULG_00001940 [Fusarium culmorum]QPC58109.1 hypothetical protein HYE67_000340 [Fusarium culmorum]